MGAAQHGHGLVLIGAACLRVVQLLSMSMSMSSWVLLARAMHLVSSNQFFGGSSPFNDDPFESFFGGGGFGPYGKCRLRSVYQFAYV
eukprot:1118098-Pelagomonas_calceolata.AAC.2